MLINNENYGGNRIVDARLNIAGRIRWFQMKIIPPPATPAVIPAKRLYYWG